MSSLYILYESVRLSASRTALRNIAGILLNRSRATETAIEYLQTNNVARLREFNDEVLRSLGDIVPPFIRASVYMVLWENDPGYDPLPDLKRITVTVDTEAHISRCIRLVRFVQASKEATQLLQDHDRMQTHSARLPIAAASHVPTAHAMMQIAQNIVAIQQARWDYLVSFEGNATPELHHIIQFLQFYSLWQQNKHEESSIIAHSYADNPYIKSYQSIIDGMQSQRLITAMEQGQHEIVSREVWQFHVVEKNATPEGFSAWLFKLVAWLLHEQKARALQTLFGVLFEDLDNHPLKKTPRIEWQLNLLAGFSAMKEDKYALTSDYMNTVLNHSYSAPEDEQQLMVWARLFRIQAEIGQASVTEKIEQSWPSMVRTINHHLDSLPDTQRVVNGYRHLIVGMLTYITSNTLVEEATINSLFFAQRVLTLHKHEDYLNQVVTTLQSRRQMVDDFWQAMDGDDFKTAKSIYNNQLAVTLRDIIPDEIEMALVLVDWAIGSDVPENLIRRVNTLIQSNENLQAVGQRLKKQITEREQIYRLQSLLGNGSYDEIITLVTTQWQGGGYPPPAAEIALLLSYVKKINYDKAGELVEKTTQWRSSDYTDYRDLLAGYIHFEKNNYELAGKRFAAIRKKQLAGKDTNYYWALAHFQTGMQLLKVNKHEEALNKFMAYLREQRKSEAMINVDLAKTLMYFGIRNIKRGSGNHALEAFRHSVEIMNKQREVLPDVEIFYFIARFGEMLTQSLLQDPEIGVVEQKAFTELAKAYETSAIYQSQNIEDPSAAFYVDYLMACYRLSITYQLRTNANKSKLNRQEFTDLANTVTADSQQLEKLLSQTRQNDIPHLAFKAIMMVRFTTPPNYDGAIELLNLLLKQLGAKHEALETLLKQLQSEYNSNVTRAKSFLSLTDTYIIEQDLGGKAVSNYIADNDDIVQLYGLYRDITPRDLPQLPVKDAIEIIQQRIERIKKWINDSAFADEEWSKKALKDLDHKLADLTKSYKLIVNIEKSIIDKASKRFFNQE